MPKANNFFNVNNVHKTAGKGAPKSTRMYFRATKTKDLLRPYDRLPTPGRLCSFTFNCGQPKIHVGNQNSVT